MAPVAVRYPIPRYYPSDFFYIFTRGTRWTSCGIAVNVPSTKTASCLGTGDCYRSPYRNPFGACRLAGADGPNQPGCCGCFGPLATKLLDLQLEPGKGLPGCRRRLRRIHA